MKTSWVVLLALATTACASTGTGGRGGFDGSGGSAGSGATGATSGTGGGGGTAGRGGTGGSGASAGSGGATASCTDLGGQCQCAGTCSAGFHSLGELGCPQPCEGCGACGMWCCVPDAADGGSDAGSLINQCGSGVCPASPPLNGTACNAPDLCCNYDVSGSSTGCICSSIGWTCDALICGCI